MSSAKIDVQVGQIKFSGEGEQDWLAKQLDRILAQAEKLIQLVPEKADETDGSPEKKPMGKDQAIAKKTLPSYLQEKGATRNQVKKFLVTAVWLEAKGSNRMTTADVTKALKTTNQTRLGNPADCLNKNVTKGFCEKEGQHFFVTGEGKDSL